MLRALDNALSSEAGERLNLEIVLRANTNGLNLDFGEIWRYRDLLLILVWRDFSAKYKQTILGPLWFLLQPIMMTLIFTVIFAHVAKVSTDKLPPLLFYLCGQLGWNYFAANINSNSTIFITNGSLFNKVYFPRLVVPLSALISNLFTFFIQGAAFLSFYFYFKYVLRVAGFGMDWRALFLPLLVLQVAALSLGCGLLFSALTGKYRDLMHVLTMLIQVWMYGTPIILPLSEFPSKWQWVVALNPMTMIVESFRLTLLGTGTVLPQYVVASVIFTILALAGGVILFGKVEKTIVDTV
jgi:lipopolysaccharide transport system permease protein